MKRYIITIACIVMSLAGLAQTGYQVALINTATGEPRAHETVSVSVEITDAAGGSIYSGSQNATSNEFGIISLSVGSESTFDKVDWNKLPLYISATVDGVLIGKTQILTVPVAEYAKRTGVLTPDILCSKTWSGGGTTFTFFKSGSGIRRVDNFGSSFSNSLTWWIEGNIVFYDSPGAETQKYLIYSASKNLLSDQYEGRFFK
ncbi:MAG: hypothetical protein HDS65_08720 [Bacteroidales bacterium]|nr:hypothetical protein [Bacteroidales bacterium]